MVLFKVIPYVKSDINLEITLIYLPVVLFDHNVAILLSL